MIVRTAQPGDLAGMLALYRAFRSFDPAFDVDAAGPAWGRMLRSEMMSVVVAEVDGMVAASCTLAVVPNMTWRGRPYGVIENVATHPGHRRAGLGHAVLAEACARAWAADCYKVMLATGSTAEGTLRFYERAGFSRGKTAFEMRRG